VHRAEASIYVGNLTASLRAQVLAKAGKTKLSRTLSGYDQREVAHYLAMIDDSEAHLSATQGYTVRGSIN
jgi:hypothetical protein